MADKYCDHGLYGAASFTASVSGTTMTVSAVASGVLSVGMQLAGTGWIDRTYITVAAAAGGVGTYTVSTTQTVASTAMTGVSGAIHPVPAWGVAQEGDGTAIGAATSATVAIDLSAATAAAGATFSIMGAVLTCVASGASTNQFNAGAGATLVANLVTAINRTTNTATIAAQATGWKTPKVQDAVYAQIGAPTTTLQIMTRAGSAQYNTSTIATAGFTGGTFGPYTFAGGAGGAWGVLNNTLGVTLPSAVAIQTYGVWAPTLLLAGVQNAGDRIFLRAAKNIWTPPNSYPSVTPPSVLGSISSPVVYVIDDATVWPADAPTPTLILSHAASSANQTLYVSLTAAALFAVVMAKRYSSGASNLQVTQLGASGIVRLELAGGASADNVDVMAAAAGAAASLVLFSATAGMCTWITGARVVSQSASTPLLNYSGNGGFAILDGCEFSGSGTASPHTSVIAQHTTQASDLRFSSCKFTNFISGSQLYPANGYSATTIEFVDCSFGNVTKRGPLLSTLATVSSLSFARYCSIGTRYGARDHSIDNARGFVEWNSLLGFPTFSALLRDGVTPWSWRVEPSTTVGAVTLFAPLVTPVIVVVNSAPANGAATFTLQFCANDAITPALTARDVSLRIEYDDASGNVVVLDSLDRSGGALTVSTGHWSVEDVTATKAKFIDAGTLLFNRYKFVLTTPAGHDLAAGSEVRATVRCHAVMATSTQYLFVDPFVTIVVA